MYVEWYTSRIFFGLNIHSLLLFVPLTPCWVILGKDRKFQTVYDRYCNRGLRNRLVSASPVSPKIEKIWFLTNLQPYKNHREMVALSLIKTECM